MSRHLLVQVDDLPNYRLNGISANVGLLPGVQRVVWLEDIARETLDGFLMAPPVEVPEVDVDTHTLELFGG